MPTVKGTGGGRRVSTVRGMVPHNRAEVADGHRRAWLGPLVAGYFKGSESRAAKVGIGINAGPINLGATSGYSSKVDMDRRAVRNFSYIRGNNAYPRYAKLFTPGKSIVRWGVAAVAAALLLGAGVFVACQKMPIGEGPLDVGRDRGRSESGGAWDIGTVVSFGAPKVHNPTDRPLLIKAIALVPADRSSGVTITGVYVADMTGVSETSGIALGFPPANQPDHTFIPAAGATLKAHTWYQILFVARIDKPGEWAFPDIDITYEGRGRLHKVTVPEGLRLCAPKGVECGR